jgi:hypothetical protein
MVDYDDDVINNTELFDIDTPVDIIQAFASNFKPKSSSNGPPDRVRMPKDKWFSPDQKTKELWDQIDDKQKAIILGYMKPGSFIPNNSNNRFPSKPPLLPNRRNVNLHDMSAYDFLQAHIHDIELKEDPDNIPTDTPIIEDTNPEPPDTLLINAATGSRSTSLPPGDIRRVISKSSKSMANLTYIEYKVSYHKSACNKSLSLIDRGANGGVAGTVVRVIFKTGRMVDIKGIDNHQCTNIDIGTVGGVVHTQKGYVIAIMHQYTLLNKGSTIHSLCQLEWYKNDVNDKSINVPGGVQRIQTLDGYIIPLSIKDGLARLHIRPYTDHEWDTLPHVILTSELEWDPSVRDHGFKTDEQWGAIPEIDDRLDQFGDYNHRVVVQHLSYFQRHDSHQLDDVIDQCIFVAQTSSALNEPQFYDAHETEVEASHADNLPDPSDFTSKVTTKRDPDYDKLRPFFGWLNTDVFKKTFDHTTQYARLPTGTYLKKAFKSPNPALNVYRRNEAVAFDIVYSDVPAIHDGSTAAVIFVGVTIPKSLMFTVLTVIVNL